MSNLRVFRVFCKPFVYFSKIKNVLFYGVQEKKHYLCEDWIEKSVHCDQRLSSLGKPRDANL